jgi:hypothetical protein
MMVVMEAMMEMEMKMEMAAWALCDMHVFILTGPADVTWSRYTAHVTYSGA